MKSKNKYVDLTVCFRFYVCKGELKLKKGDKSKVLGFFRKDKTHKKIGIRYKREEKEYLQFFDASDSISIKK